MGGILPLAAPLLPGPTTPKSWTSTNQLLISPKVGFYLLSTRPIKIQVGARSGALPLNIRASIVHEAEDFREPICIKYQISGTAQVFILKLAKLET